MKNQATTPKYLRLSPVKVIPSIVLAALLVSAGFFNSFALAEPSTEPETPVEAEDTSSDASTKESSSDASSSANAGAKRSSEAGKEEVVYANLSGEGVVEGIYVVNEFDLTAPGKVTDYGNYSKVSNLTSTNEIKQEGDKITTQAEKGEFFYEGTLESSDLPWDFMVTYTLDGKELSAEEVAGKEGGLEIHLTTKQNSKVDRSFYDNYLLQITVTLDSERCSNIRAEGATIANAGKKKSIVMTVMPEKDGDITIQSTVHDFAMDGIQIAAMPFSTSLDLGDTDEMVEEMDPLVKAMSDLNEGVYTLSTGAQSLSSGAKQMVKGSADYKSGLSQLSGNSQELVGGSTKIQQGLNTIVSEMSGSSGSFDLSQLDQLPTSLRTVSGGLSSLSAILGQTRDSLSYAQGTLEASIQNIPAVGGTSNLDVLVANSGDVNAQAEYSQLLAHQAATQTMINTYYSSVQPALNGVVAAINAIIDPASPNSLNGIAGGLNVMANEIETALANADLASLQKLLAGLKELSSNYEVFHSGLVAYTSGIDQASAGYASLHGGLVSLAGGVDDLAQGTQELYVGTTQLNEAVSAMPDEMREKMNELLGGYDKSDFTPVSFVSSKNKDVKFVQFVITTKSISVEEEAVAEAPEEESSSPLDQFLALFS